MRMNISNFKPAQYVSAVSLTYSAGFSKYICPIVFQKLLVGQEIKKREKESMKYCKPFHILVLFILL